MNILLFFTKLYPSFRAPYQLLKRDKTEGLEKNIFHDLVRYPKIEKPAVTFPPHPFDTGSQSKRRTFILIKGSSLKQFSLTIQILNIWDESTQCTTTRFLKNQSACNIWRSLERLWFQEYMVWPSFLIRPILPCGNSCFWANHIMTHVRQQKAAPPQGRCRRCLAHHGPL